MISITASFLIKALYFVAPPGEVAREGIGEAFDIRQGAVQLAEARHDSLKLAYVVQVDLRLEGDPPQLAAKLVKEVTGPNGVQDFLR